MFIFHSLNKRYAGFAVALSPESECPSISTHFKFAMSFAVHFYRAPLQSGQSYPHVLRAVVPPEAVPRAVQIPINFCRLHPPGPSLQALQWGGTHSAHIIHILHQDIPISSYPALLSPLTGSHMGSIFKSARSLVLCLVIITMGLFGLKQGDRFNATSNLSPPSSITLPPFLRLVFQCKKIREREIQRHHCCRVCVCTVITQSSIPHRPLFLQIEHFFQFPSPLFS